MALWRDGLSGRCMPPEPGALTREGLLLVLAPTVAIAAAALLRESSLPWFFAAMVLLAVGLKALTYGEVPGPARQTGWVLGLFLLLLTVLALPATSFGVPGTDVVVQRGSGSLAHLVLPIFLVGPVLLFGGIGHTAMPYASRLEARMLAVGAFLAPLVIVVGAGVTWAADILVPSDVVFGAFVLSPALLVAGVARIVWRSRAPPVEAGEPSW